EEVTEEFRLSNLDRGRKLNYDENHNMLVLSIKKELRIFIKRIVLGALDYAKTKERGTLSGTS
ncbi:MAG: hypothetical protein ACTSQQ_05100, partial [Candidatus Helarchaeota archaeon]